MVERFIEKPNLPRQPRGTRAGGRFAQRENVASEPVVELGEGELAELDGGRGRDELERRRAKAIAASAKETSRTKAGMADDAAVLEGMEASLRDTLGDDHFFESDASNFAPEQKPVIVLGGKTEFSEGSWAYPPSPQIGVDRLADFWARTLIPEGSTGLGNIEAADRWGRLIFISKYEAEFDEWKKTQPTQTSRFIRKHPDEAAVVEEEWKARRQYIDRIRYGIGLIPREELRDATRLYGFLIQAGKICEEAYFEAATREFRTSAGQTVTPLEVATKYRLHEIVTAWTGTKYQRLD